MYSSEKVKLDWELYFSAYLQFVDIDGASNDKSYHSQT